MDCEGKWGMGDRDLSKLAFITSKELDQAYLKLLDLFDKYTINATFGFVAALCLERAELQDKIPELYNAFTYNGRHWLSGTMNEMMQGKFEGWSEPQLIDHVLARGIHHICSHGGTHIPYSETGTPVLAIRQDIELIKAVHHRKKLELDTLIFPRNIVGYREELVTAGFRGYRDMDTQERRGGILGKIGRLLNEYVPLDTADLKNNHAQRDGQLARLSSAKFLNARIGFRKLVLSNFTRNRLDQLLKRTIHDRGVMHIYSHPHNYIRDRDLFATLDYLLMQASNLRRTEKLNILTMKDELDERTGA